MKIETTLGTNPEVRLDCGRMFIIGIGTEEKHPQEDLSGLCYHTCSKNSLHFYDEKDKCVLAITGLPDADMWSYEVISVTRYWLGIIIYPYL